MPSGNVVDAEFDDGPDEGNGAAAPSTALVRVDNGALATLTKSEIEAQVEVARHYPRSIAKFMDNATAMITLSRDVAKSCLYLLPRGKGIPGPSVRLAEIAASTFGNIAVQTRVLDPTATEAVAEGIAWDMESNNRQRAEVRRSIINKFGKRFASDMITVTGAAAAAIAKRNAIFNVIPRAFIDTLYAKAKACAVGDAKTLPERRTEVLAWLAARKKAVSPERVCAALGVTSVDDIGVDELEKLMALVETCKRGEVKIEEAFPVPGAAPPKEGAGQTLEEKLAAKAGKGPAVTTPAQAAPEAPAGATIPSPAPAAATAAPAREAGDDSDLED